MAKHPRLSLVHPGMKTITGGLAVMLIASGLAACSSPIASAPPASDGPTARPSPVASPSSAPGSPSVPPTAAPSTPNPDAGIWRAAAPMNVGRVGFDAVELGDGSVLVVGDDHACVPGGAEPGSERAEIYEPAADRWVEIQSLNKPRKIAATVPLADGSAMVIGGVNEEDVPFSSTKILSPSTRTWTDGPLLDIARGVVAAAGLGDGRILVASAVAQEETSQLITTEIYDPSTGAWTSGGDPLHMYFGSLKSLTDGRVLAIGGAFETGVWLEIYDPSTQTWTAIETPGEWPAVRWIWQELESAVRRAEGRWDPGGRGVRRGCHGEGGSLRPAIEPMGRR